MSTHRFVHALVYSESGSGKSSFAATFPKPMLVCSFDPRSKEIPYLEAGGRIEEGDGFTKVYSRKNPAKLIIQVEYFHDPADDESMRSHSAYEKFKRRFKTMAAEGWLTIVFDSLTFMEIAFRKYDQKVLNVGAKDKRQFYSASTNELEEIIMNKTCQWLLNFVVIAHTDFDKEAGDSGVLRYRPKVPGQKALRDIGAAFGEFYHTYVEDGEDGERQYLLQTQSSRLFQAATRIHAPNPCLAHYQALWITAEGEGVLEKTGEASRLDEAKDESEGNRSVDSAGVANGSEV